MLNKVLFFSFENRVVNEITWKNAVEPNRPHMTIWRMRITCWVPKTTNNTLTICNTYCFSTATMVARMSLNVTQCSYCLPRYNRDGLCLLRGTN